MLIPKKSIQTMKPYSGPSEGRIDCLRLDFNENLFGASPMVLEAVRNVPREAYGCYPEYAGFKKILSESLDVPEASILPTNGGDEAIRAIFDTYIEKGDTVILLSPSYSMYELYAQVAGANIVRIPYRQDDFSFPLEEILEAIQSDTRLIAIVNPNNPTGCLVKRGDLVKIIEKNPAMAILIDEAYAQYAQATNIDLASMYSNVFILRTFSKAYGLAGLRIGFLVSDQNNVEAISKVISSAYSVGCLAVAAAVAAMEDAAYVESHVREIISARDRFIDEVASYGFWVAPSRANFALIRFGMLAKPIKEELEQQHILVRDRSDLDGFLRITIGSWEHMEKVLRAVRNLCSKTALIFDMDGVLVDETRSYRPCIAKTAEFFLRRPVDPDEVELLKRQGGYNNDYDCTAALLRTHGVEIGRDEIEKRFDSYYQDLKFQERWLVDEQILADLKKVFRLGIFTGRPKKDALDALQRFDKERFFEIVISDDDVRKRKPDPEGLRLAIQELRVDRAIYFGDSRDDCAAAAGAGVGFVEVFPSGYGVTDILRGFLC